LPKKPSVALDISKALGGFKKAADYYESDDYVLSSAVGHLLEIACPEEYEVKRGKWSFAHLPVVPPYFDLKPIAKSEDRLKTLVKLLKRKDVTALINACDAGREGELIFRLIVQHAKSKHPVKRLWLQSMTPTSIRDGFASLRADKDMLPLADAARSRSEADWLIGINGTRAMTAFNSKEGGFYLTTVGRVQTPTLAVMVEREERIRAFKPRDYWEVHATFKAKAGEYNGRWFAPISRNRKTTSMRAPNASGMPSAPTRSSPNAPASPAPSARKPSRLRKRRRCCSTSPACSARPTAASVFSARTTLSIAQALYEKHKVLTYPRTDARALPEDYIPTVKKTMEMLGEATPTWCMPRTC